MIIDEEDYLAHYGTPRHSGRYPWGSGGNEEGLEKPHRSMTFLDTVEDLRRQGLSDPEICIGMGIGTTDRNGNFRPSTTRLRAEKSIANNEIKQAQIAMAQALADKANSNVAIGKRMGLNESVVRTLLAPGAKDKADNNTVIANMLKEHVDAKTYLDVGSGNELSLGTGVSQTKLTVAIEMLKKQGYQLHPVKIHQQGTGFDTNSKILVPPGVTQRDVFLNQDKIQQIASWSEDGGRTFGKIHPPIIINPNRVSIRYKEDGGDTAEGVIYVRPGVEDIAIGKKLYGQVRIQVGENHYLKGMAIYKDDLPPGTDLVFNTTKSKVDVGTDKRKVMKELESDKDYPFGSIVRQVLADEGTANERVTSAMNMIGSKPGSGEEGSWGQWKNTISSQVLSKQSPALAKAQLAVTYERRQKEFEEIKALTNPTVRKKLLESFADDTDSAAVHLKAAALPKSNWHVILPIDSIKPTEIYAPGYRDGERVALIRYPHGGKFEIPELIVNSKNREARKALGTTASDAVGIHHSVAKHLSGADFDGDTVLVIPNNNQKIKHTPALEGLKNFDHIREYPKYEGMVVMDKARKQQEMGKISNLITDMTLRGAPTEHIVRAVRHSMVVIDAEKKELNYKLSAQRNGIAALKAEYQYGSNKGASTLISKKKRTVSLPHLKDRPYKDGGPIDKETGRIMKVPSGETTRFRDGTIGEKKGRYNLLALTDDAHSLSSHTPMERLYADHSNRLKSLANQARVAAIKTPRLKMSDSAKRVYGKEVQSLNAKLKLVKLNRPLERQAQVIAKASIRTKLQANPNLDKDDVNKIRWKEQEIARARTGAHRIDIKFTSDEWNAIQAGAITDSKLRQMLDKADIDQVRKLATPRRELKMTTAKTDRARQMLALGYTRAQVAQQLGVSLSTLDIATN